jgi:hypothetical protein
VESSSLKKRRNLSREIDGTDGTVVCTSEGGLHLRSDVTDDGPRSESADIMGRGVESRKVGGVKAKSGGRVPLIHDYCGMFYAPRRGELATTGWWVSCDDSRDGLRKRCVPEDLSYPGIDFVRA